jgi:hypothetical protein
MTPDTIIRRTDGSIDAEVYLTRARRNRSRKACAFLHRLRGLIARLASPAPRPYGAAGETDPRD